MRKLILYRLASSFIVLILLSVLLFGMVQLSPIDPVAIALGDGATLEQRQALIKEWGLDNPFVVRYFTWAMAALQGDFGVSLIGSEPVTAELVSRLPVTASLFGGAIFLMIFVGGGIGLFAGMRPGSPADRAVTLATSIGLALPGFWLGILLANAFAVQFRWFPVVGYTPLGENPFEWARGLVLPCIALAIHGIAVIARQTRGTVIEAFDAPYVQTLRANGTPERVITFKFALKNALAPVLPVIGIQIGIIIANSVVMERIYALPGIGSLLIDAIVSNDLPVLLGGVMLIACLVLVVNLLIDIGLGVLDPRVRPA